MGKVIHWELYKKLKFDHIDKEYMYKLKSLLEIEAHKILCDFDIQTVHRISVRRRPDLVLINKKKRVCDLEEFAVTGGPQNENERKRKKWTNI